jgi:hypothetical protein
MYKQLRKKGRSDKEPRHVRLYHVMMKTAAWKSLSANARAIYVEMAAPLRWPMLEQRAYSVFGARRRQEPKDRQGHGHQGI